MQDKHLTNFHVHKQQMQIESEKNPRRWWNSDPGFLGLGVLPLYQIVNSLTVVRGCTGLR